jgi:hypothetical protein
MRTIFKAGTSVSCFALVLSAAAAPLFAQERGLVGPPAIEAVASIANSSEAPLDPNLFFDLAATVPLGTHFGAVVRPYAHRLEGGDWAAEMYQLQLRYQSTTRIPIRVDAGIITSPLGLGTLQLRADQNPAIKIPFYYYMPLPRFDTRNHDVQLTSGGYPLGAVISSSGTKWDVRAGITDSTPARERNVFASDRPAAMRQFVVGGGVTPVVGLRVGAGLAHGAYRTFGPDLLDASSPIDATDVTVFNIEAEFSFGHTKFSGEWIRDRFESPLGPSVARGYYVQAVQTFTPRLFGTVQVVSASAPAYINQRREQKTMTSAEVSAGYRLHEQFTLRAGYYASRHFFARQHTHTAVASLVWAHRWF